ncbi:MAG: T9SS type A sorting domain-containing protein [Candidatus Zophobacter franzmannii]|nr:T9SS type A sorting domain-containing protein [Candidatus Zophobacter franzmannii]
MQKRFIIIISLFIIAFQLLSVTYYVSQDGTNTDGLSWSSAFNEVQDGIDNAVSGDEVWVAKGKYEPTLPNPRGTNGAVLERTKAFIVRNGIDVYGGFAGDETSIDERCNYWIGQSNETILSGDLDENDDYTQWDTYNSSVVNNDSNSYNVVYYYNVSTQTILNGFTISGGNANIKVSRTYHDGGGAHLTNDKAYLKNCRLIYNRGNNAGGAITFGGGTLIDCVISHNLATGECGDTGDGGGVKLHNGGKLINCIVTENYSSNNSARGGGVCCSWTTGHRIVNSVIVNNKTNGYGGGIGNYGTRTSSTKAYNCIIWGNYQDASKVQIGGTSMTINYCGVESGYTGSGNISLDASNELGPMFFNPIDGDWRLESTSSCLNAGSNSYTTGIDSQIPVISTDIDGNPRILDLTVDMGAYEQGYIVLNPDANGIIYVNSASSGLADGSSWANATSWLQGALDSGSSEIWLAEGTYYPTQYISGMESDDRARSFVISNDIVIYGGFPESANDLDNASLDSRDVSAYSVYLSGDIGQPGIFDDNSYHVAYLQNLSSLTRIDGIIVTKGNANGVAPNNTGGGLYLVNSSPEIVAVTAEDNYADDGNDAIYVDETSSPTVSDSPGIDYDDGTLPVVLSYFEAVDYTDYEVTLRWRTESENSLIGFNILRSESETNGDMIRINNTTILAQNSSNGSEYTYDDVEVFEAKYYYWLESVSINGHIDLHGPVEVLIEEDDSQQDNPDIRKSALLGIYPNPFNPSTNISFYIAEECNVEVKLYNIKGELTKNIFEGDIDKDTKMSLPIDATDLPSGIYFVRWITPNLNEIRKVALIK